MQKEAILTRDKDISFPEFVILKASAGTGKTRALTLRFTQFLLSRHIKNSNPDQILAITFTRNATKEMKERIIGWLKKCYFLSDGGSPDHDLEEIQKLVTLEKGQLKSRAEEILNKILRDYSDFQVTTIDSFMSSIFKAASVELGVSPDTEITIDSSPVISYAFSRLLNQVRPDSAEFNNFLEICRHLKEMRGSEKSFAWDPVSDLESIFINFNRKLAGAHRRAIILNLTESREELSRLEEKFQVSRTKVSSLVSSWGGCPKNSKLLKYLARNNLIDWLDYDFGILEKDTLPVKVAQELQQLKKIINRYQQIQAKIFYQPHIRIYNLFLDRLNQTKRETGVVFLEDVHCRLADYLDRGAVPDVYYSLGTEIYHYLIDEFQDTSPLQWRNLYPLIENALSQGGSLFIVGDTKQAIYGFREADYQIMVNLMTGRDGFAPVKPRIAELRQNWRSRSQVLEWVTKIFPEGFKNLPVETLNWSEGKLWKAAASQSLLDDFVCLPAVPDKSSPGYAELKLVNLKSLKNSSQADQEKGQEEENSQELDSPEKTEVQNLIQDLIKRGYSYSDLAILAYENDQVNQAAAWLNEKNIPFIPFSALDIRSRPIIREILAFLQFLDYPLDELNFSVFLCGQLFQQKLQRDGFTLGPEAIREFILDNRLAGPGPLYASFRTAFPEIWKANFENFFKTAGYLPLYDLVCQIYGVFRPLDLFPREEGSLVKLLEVIKNFEGQGKSNLRDFIKFSAAPTDDKNVWTIDVPENLDAVRIMTVHKAKGLGFPVVILLLYREQVKGEDFYLEEIPASLLPDRQGPRAVRVLKLNSTTARSSPRLQATYENHRQRERVNKLNTLYVALTRAREELYVIAVKKRNEYPFPLLEAMLGLESKNRDASSDRRPAMRKQRKPADRRRQNLAVLKINLAERFPRVAPGPGFNYYDKKRGELKHRLLAAVEFIEEDLGSVISRALNSLQATKVPSAELQQAGESLREFLSWPQARPYFERRPGRTVYREIELVDSRGRLFRADRVVIDPDRVTVIDFKSGLSDDPELKSAYQAQLRGYMAILAEIYPDREIAGLLIYPDQKKLEKI